MRKTGITGEVIKMYENAGLDVNTIYAKSQLLLCSYRRICWSVQNDAYYLMDEYTKGRNSQRRQKGGGAHKQQGAGSFSGRAVVSRCASISVMLFPLIYCSVTCSTQAQ